MLINNTSEKCVAFFQKATKRNFETKFPLLILPSVQEFHLIVKNTLLADYTAGREFHPPPKHIQFGKVLIP
jgi:hypothetical protein